MNNEHRRLCGSPEWAAHLQENVIGPLLKDLHLGKHLLEIGPGFGAATSWLCVHVEHLTAIELDPAAAHSLASLHSDSNVRVLIGDASMLPFRAESFDSAACFTMLHHIPTFAQQNQVLAEIHRVLVPGGVVVVSDSLASNMLHRFHADDTYDPVEPSVLITRLQIAGFQHITLTVSDHLTVIAYRPHIREEQQERSHDRDRTRV